MQQIYEIIMGFVVKAPKLVYMMFRVFLLISDIVPS